MLLQWLLAAVVAKSLLLSGYEVTNKMRNVWVMIIEFEICEWNMVISGLLLVMIVVVCEL